MAHSLLALAAALVSAPGEQDVLDAIERRYQRLFDQLAPSVVFITAAKGSGSGFFVDESGLVLTNAHVVEGSSTAGVVLFDGRRLSGKVVETATGDVDLALLQVDLKGAPVPVLDSGDGLRIGSWAASVGHGRELVWTFTTGMVSNIYPSENTYPVFQTQIPLNPGASGGPIIDRLGRVVGVVVAGAKDANSINLSYKLDVAFMYLERLSKRCNCLVVHAPAEAPIFLDGALVGKGPRAAVRPTAGGHDVFAVVSGKMIRRRVNYPEDSRVKLE